ncbi:MAG: hypothetical protein PVSMB1_06900 [Gemmatimonadaceae bacterium]
MDAQNAPTGVWKSRKDREIPTAPTSIVFFLKDEEKNEEQINSNQLSTKSDQIQGDRTVVKLEEQARIDVWPHVRAVLKRALLLLRIFIR